MPQATILREEVWGRQESEVREVFELTHLKWSRLQSFQERHPEPGGECELAVR